MKMGSAHCGSVDREECLNLMIHVDPLGLAVRVMLLFTEGETPTHTRPKAQENRNRNDDHVLVSRPGLYVIVNR